ncbi:MAG: hypothetical protein K5656_09605 [Lachnospiraceae bacterium]|nr:hypothetical protein [Lachnospiraceae bacterium]
MPNVLKKTDMDILLITTRDYYNFYPKDEHNDWEKISLGEIIRKHISSLLPNEDDPIGYFFLKEDGCKSARDFWKDVNRKGEEIFILKRFIDNLIVYVLPCIPLYYLNKEWKSTKSRQDYIGSFVKNILDLHNNDDKIIYIAAHDLDILDEKKENNRNRNMREGDVAKDSIMESLISNGYINLCNVFCYQHTTSYELYSHIKSLNKSRIDETCGKIIKWINSSGVSILSDIEPAPKEEKVCNYFKLTYKILNGKIIISSRDYSDKNYLSLVSSITKIFSNEVFEDIPSLLNGDYSAIVLMHISSTENASFGKQYSFGQNYFINNNNSQVFPIIHFCLFPLYANPDKESLSKEYRYASIIDSSIWNYFIQYKLDEVSNEISLSSSILYKILRSIANNQHQQLYNLIVAREYSDLNARLTMESWLPTIAGELGHGGAVSPFVFHSEQEISKLIEKEFITTHSLGLIKKHKWRILLVDDKAVAGMSPYKNDSLGEKHCKLSIINNLLENIFGNITYRPFSQDNQSTLPHKVENSSNILIEYVQTYHETLEALKKRKYDIILLDYLLDKQEDRQYYGYDILEEICKFVDVSNSLKKWRKCVLDTQEKVEEELFHDAKNSIIALLQIIEKEITENDVYNEKKSQLLASIVKIENNIEDNNKIKHSIFNNKKEITEHIKQCIELLSKEVLHELEQDSYLVGPNKRFFFMFISAYSSAVSERLLAYGLNQSEKYWHISLGACPTNTPQLFLYNLIKLMEKRLEDSNIDNLSIEGMMEVVKEIYGIGGSVRKNASEHYHKIQSFQYYYRNLLKDYDISVGKEKLFETDQSVLVTDYLNNRINIGGLLEHLAQLVNLTGFGTIRQWPEMWEEYLYVKAQLEPLIVNEEEKKVFNNICHSVEDYIKELKSEAI